MHKQKIFTQSGRVAHLSMVRGNYAEHRTNGTVTAMLKYDRTLHVIVNGVTLTRTQFRHIDEARAALDLLTREHGLS